MSDDCDCSALTSDEAFYFRDRLRDARGVILRDSEAYEAVVLVLEQLGRLVAPKGGGLNDYKCCLTQLAAPSPLACHVPADYPEYHLTLETLFDLVRKARNAAVHEGALARHLTTSALELALIIEDALMPNPDTLGAFMVRSPVVALPWQPLSFIRQTMLVNSFSFLPVRVPVPADGGEQRWQVVSDLTISRFLRSESEEIGRRKRLGMRLQDAVANRHISLLDVPTAIATARIAKFWEQPGNLPLLVTAPTNDELVGIVTAFDLL